MSRNLSRAPASLVILLFVLVRPVFSQQIGELVERELASLVELYKELHAAPELSYLPYDNPARKPEVSAGNNIFYSNRQEG